MPTNAVPESISVIAWDLPIRLFHWALAVLILLQYGTAEWHWLDMQWHVRFGYATLALLVFRVAWGFFGSQTARFADFVRGPRRVSGYVRAVAAGHATPTSLGHNPLGGWSVLAMLASLLVQTITGLFASNHRHTVFGPWADRVSDIWSQRLTDIHKINQNVLLFLIALHVVAILAYWIGRSENLIAPMLHGRKTMDSPPAVRFASTGRALAVLAFAILLVWLAVLAGARI